MSAHLRMGIGVGKAAISDIGDNGVCDVDGRRSKSWYEIGVDW